MYKRQVAGVSTFSGIGSFGTDMNVGITTFFVDKSTGRIGIGTNVPTAALEIGKTAGTGIGVSIFQNGNACFSGIVTVGGNLDVTGDITYDEITGRNLNITGITTLAGTSNFNGDVNLGNATSDTITPTGRFDADILPASDGAIDLGATGAEFQDLFIDGTANIDALVADTAKISDLTNNRVVLSGADGELTDNSELTFNNSTFNVGTGVTIQSHGGVSIAGIVTIGGNLNVQGDIVYDEITGRNLNITGISTQAGQANFGASGIGATIAANGNASFSGIVTATQFQGGGVGVGIKTTGGVIGYGFTTLNFIGTGNTFATSGTTVDISIAGGGGGGGVSEEETAVSSTSATAVGTFAKASFRSAAIIAQITQGSAYQMGRYLLIHDGTTVTVVEEAAVATGSMLGTFSGAINGSNVEFKVTMGSSSSATVTVKIDTVSIP